MEAAELAAGAGDFTSAEQHLNRAVELEEVSFGADASPGWRASSITSASSTSVSIDPTRRRGLLPARVWPLQRPRAAGRPGHRAERGEPSRVLRGTRHSVRALRPRACLRYRRLVGGYGGQEYERIAADRPAAKVAPALPPSFLRTVEKPVARRSEEGSSRAGALPVSRPVEARRLAALMAPVRWRSRRSWSSPRL